MVHKRGIGGVFLFCILMLFMGLTVSAGANQTLRVGEQITLSAPASSSKYTWTVDSNAVVSLEETDSQYCKITGMRAGTAVVRVNYSKLEWDSSKTDI